MTQKMFTREEVDVLECLASVDLATKRFWTHEDIKRELGITQTQLTYMITIIRRKLNVSSSTLALRHKAREIIEKGDR